MEIETSHDFHKIKFHELASPDMNVVEIDGTDRIKPSDIEDLLPNPNIHTLLRITLLSIRPIWSKKMLHPLFSVFKRQFNFDPIDVSYR